MIDWSGSLARAFAKHLQVGGFAGFRGSRHSITKARTETATDAPVVPVVSPDGRETDRNTTFQQLVSPRLTREAKPLTRIRASETTETSETTEIEDDRASAAASAVDDAYEERAALIQEGTGVPREWAEGFARLNITRRPNGFTHSQWEQVLNDGGRFLDSGWAEKAAGVGWSVLDVFGVHPLNPNGRYEAMGLVPLIRGGAVIDIKADMAVIRMPSGSNLTYYLRRRSPDAVALWKLNRAKRSDAVVWQAVPHIKHVSSTEEKA